MKPNPENNIGNKDCDNRETLRYVLIDDEQLTRIYIEQVISQLRPKYVKNGETVSTSGIGKLLDTAHPDFIISGVRLSDGDCMAEYKRLGCRIPKIIYTAYPETLTGTTDLNIVHSALKPVPANEVELSLEKIEKAINSKTSPS